MITSTTAQPGTEKFAQMLSREAEVIKIEMKALQDLAKARASANGTMVQVEMIAVQSSPSGIATQRDVEEFNAKASAHNAALKAARQARANARQATKTQAASCDTCFTVHAGECY